MALVVQMLQSLQSSMSLAVSMKTKHKVAQASLSGSTIIGLVFLCLLTYHQGCSGALQLLQSASWTHTDARSICIDEYLLKRWRSLPRLKLLLSQYHFSSLICSNLQCCYSSRIAVRAVVDTVNTLAVQVLLT